MTYRTLARSCFVAVIAVALAVDSAIAVTVSPMQVEMTSSGNRSHTTVTVINDGGEPMPIEAVVKSMTLDEAGKATTAEAGEDFLIMPPQTIIPAGATQNFRIQWLGEPMLDQSRSFYVFFNQVPVRPTAGKSAVQIVMSIGALVNVAPPQGTPSLKVVDTGLSAPDKAGRRYATVTVLNPGNVHALFSQASVRLAGGVNQTLQPGLLAEKLGSGLVQPGKRRKFTLPVEIPTGAAAVQTSVEFTPKRP